VLRYNAVFKATENLPRPRFTGVAPREREVPPDDRPPFVPPRPSDDAEGNPVSRALLALADGRLFWGKGHGPEGIRTGEVVFQTAQTGYQEILTDPSYMGQIVVFTVAHLGNVGVNPEDMESARPQVAGFVTRHLSEHPSSWRARASLPAFLETHGLIALSGVDTRALTRRLRDGGAQNGCLVHASHPDPEEAVARARACPSLVGDDSAARVGTKAPHDWTEGLWGRPGAPAPAGPRVVVYDFGVKTTILRQLAARGCRVRVVPASTSAAETLALAPHGVVYSNGPGDPAAMSGAVATLRELLAAGVPFFGICLGHQLLALALGARTYKMKFGHHGANHPVADLATGTVAISSQNHGFAVAEDSLPPGVRVSHRSLFDGTIQGLVLEGRAVLSLQGHPEASPGPHDLAPVFDRFVALATARQENARA